MIEDASYDPVLLASAQEPYMSSHIWTSKKVEFGQFREWKGGLKNSDISKTAGPTENSKFFLEMGDQARFSDAFTFHLTIIVRS